MDIEKTWKKREYSKMQNKYLYVLIFLILLATIGGIFIFANSGSKTQNQPYTMETPESTITPTAEPGATASAQKKMEDKLIIEDQVVGQGTEATAGHKVTVNYTGTLTDGTKFDSSYDHGAPFSFNLGASEVIAGWDQGVAGMKVGGKRKLTIPASLGYGSSGVPGAIPPNATLIFVVELLKVE